MADNTIANAIKFLKGEEKSLPATKTEGQVYFAYKNVGTAEKPSYTGAIYIDTPIGGTQNRVKMTANADIADKAFNDSAGLNIRETYLSSLGYTDDGKQTILIKGSGNNQTRIALPIASTTKSGIVTTDAQSFGGTKTFTTINSTNLTITGPDGFNYSGIGTGTADAVRPVWFADNSGNGKPVVNDNFTYNPATQTLSVANLSGTADKANKDNAGNDIRSTYISNITLDDSIMTITKGSGATSTLSIKDKLYSGAIMATKDDLDKFIEANVFKFGHINAIEGYNGLEKNNGIILSSSWKSSAKYGHQIFIDDSGYALRHRYKNSTWSDWASILDSTNYNSYAPTKTGGGASGTWGISISGNAASANKLNTDAGSVIQPIYFKDGKPVATTYSLNATVKAGVSSRIAYYSGNNEISSASSLKYYTAINNKKAAQTVLRIWSSTYGNDATNTISGKASSLSWNDGGPQIQFSTSEAGAQDGALIFTDNDSAGIGASFHFVSSESDWSVVSKRFVAKTSVIIGQESHTVSNQGYNLYVNGTEYIKGVLTAVGDCAFIAHGNEFNFVPTLKATSSVWFNYRQTGGQPTADNFIINEYVFGNGANKALASIKDGLFSGAATYVRDSNSANNISITYSKAGQASTSWLASWNGYELGAISPANVTAGKATALTSSAGSSTQPVYFSGGKPVAIGYTIAKSVPSNAVFTDTNTWRPLGTTGDTACAGNDSRLSNARPASDVYGWAKASTKPSYSWGEISGKPGSFTPNFHTHNYVVGSYTGSGGQQNPNYFGTNKVGFLMMDTTVNGDSSYKDWIIMDCYGGSDVGGGVALGVNRQRLAAYIMRSDASRKAWAESAELLHTSNYTSYTVTKSGSGASGTWGINVTGSAGSVAWGNVSGRPSSLPASDVYSWAKASSKPSYSWSEITNKPSSFNPSSHTHPYLPLAGGTMTGTINFTANKLACNFRSDSGDFASGVMHQSYGNEALVFATTKAVTSFIFKCGQNPTSMTSNTWTNITPSMMIKNQSVYINYSVANDATPIYNFCVNGTTRCRGTLGVGAGSGSAEIDFFPSSSSTIGARIKAYNDRIEFVFS